MSDAKIQFFIKKIFLIKASLQEINIKGKFLNNNSLLING